MYTRNRKGGNIKIKRLIKIVFIVFSIITLNIFTIINSSKAAYGESVQIVSEGECGSLLKYKGIVVLVHNAQYFKDGSYYPAYCLDKAKKGVDENTSYSVSIQNAISDVQLWRIIINGYPYKTIEQLGCANKEEAFTATKQAIYCYIHGNNPSDYQAIGEAGNRTLNALNKILQDSQNSNETQISNTVSVTREAEQFEIDEKEPKYGSKIYSIKVPTSINSYKVEINKVNNELPEGIKITDLNNNQKQEFSQNEKFKILIPIKNLTNDIEFNITINTKIYSKPVFFGQAGDSSYQDYALTAATYEDSKGESQDKCPKNETKIKIIKQDEETKERLENVTFNIYDSEKNIVYANLKTDANGEIELKNIIPGKYYIQETSAKDGYLPDEELKEFEISLNEELNILINNIFEKKPNIEIKKQETSKSIVKKLPVTGM